MPNASPRPWRMFLPLTVVVLLALIWSGYWYVASGIARQNVAAERARMAEKGFTLACSQESWGGYPFHFEFTCSSPILTYTGEAEIRSTNLLLVALAYAPWQVAALIDGPSVASIQGFAPTEIKHQRSLAAVTFDKAWKPSFSADLPSVSVANLGQAEKLKLFTRPSAADGTELALQGIHVTYVPEGKPPVSIDDASLLGKLQKDQTFGLDKFELRQGQLRYWGSGTLSVDQQHRISGQIDTETNDIGALLAIAGPQLGLSESKLTNLRTILGLLGNGAKAAIIAKDGALYLGPFQIAELKPLY